MVTAALAGTEPRGPNRGGSGLGGHGPRRGGGRAGLQPGVHASRGRCLNGSRLLSADLGGPGWPQPGIPRTTWKVSQSCRTFPGLGGRWTVNRNQEADPSCPQPGPSSQGRPRAEQGPPRSRLKGAAGETWLLTERGGSTFAPGSSRGGGWALT